MMFFLKRWTQSLKECQAKRRQRWQESADWQATVCVPVVNVTTGITGGHQLNLPCGMWSAQVRARARGDLLAGVEDAERDFSQPNLLSVRSGSSGTLRGETEPIPIAWHFRPKASRFDDIFDIEPTMHLPTCPPIVESGLLDRPTIKTPAVSYSSPHRRECGRIHLKPLQEGMPHG